MAKLKKLTFSLNMLMYHKKVSGMEEDTIVGLGESEDEGLVSIWYCCWLE